MNKEQRKQLNTILSTLEEAISQLEDIKDDEQGKLDNMQQKWEGTEKYSNMEEAVSELEDAINDLNSAKDNIDNVINK